MYYNHTNNKDATAREGRKEWMEMKVKALVKKIADFGTDPFVIIQENGKQLGCGTPYEVERRFGDMRVEIFIAIASGEFLVFVYSPTR